jgi:streptogramin lyase
MRPTIRLVAAVLTVLLALVAAPAVTASVQSFTLLSAGNGIALGPDGNLWVAEEFNDTVAQVSPAGTVLAHYPVGDGPTTVTTGPGGRVWVAVTGADKLVWFDATSASPTAHDVPTTGLSACGPAALVSGGDGRMYFSLPSADGTCNGGTSRLGSVTDAGTGAVAANIGGLVFDLAVASGKLYAPDFGADVIRRISLGTSPIVETTVTMPSGSEPDGIAADGTGQLWVTAWGSGQIARFPATQNNGAATAVPLTGGVLAEPFGIVASSDGRIYATGKQSGNIVRISADGTSTTFYPVPGSQPYAVVDGPDGDLFVTDQAQPRILRFVNSAPRATSRPAGTVATTTAQASAVVDPRGNETQVVFDYGTSAAYGHTTRAQVLAGAATPVTVTSKLSGLKPGTRYHLRVRASSAEGSVIGTDVVFTTRRLPKLAVTTRFSVAHGQTSVIKRLRLAKLRGGEKVTIRCAGAKCPFKTKAYSHLRKGQRSFGKSLWKGRHLPQGTQISVRVTAPRMVGRSTVLTVRKGRAPRIVQACLQPGATRPTRC